MGGCATDSNPVFTKKLVRERYSLVTIAHNVASIHLAILLGAIRSTIKIVRHRWEFIRELSIVGG